MSIDAQIPSISLSTVISDLGQTLTAPSGFEFTLTDSTILLQKSGSSYDFLLGTQLSTYGSAAFTVQNNNGTWGFAFGLGVDVTDLSTLPGLSFLSTLSSGFGLEEIVLILSSVSDTNFTFPQLSVFNNPSITATSLSSPAWTGGVVEGLNFYAMLDPSKSSALGTLASLVNFTGTFATTLEVPADPDDGTVLSVTLGGSINSSFSLENAALQAKLTGTELTIGATASIPATIDGQSVTFTVEVDVDENGAFISGSTTDTITFANVVSLGGLAIEIGMDLEGIPSFGVAAEISTSDFDSSIAIFFDSTDPAQSMFAGSISDVSLLTVMPAITGVQTSSLPQAVQDFLGQISLKGTNTFTISSTLADNLNARDAAPVIAAFAAQGVTLNSNAADISILSGTSATSWAVTDLSTLTHYSLTEANGSITVEQQAQVCFVPQATQIGNLPTVQSGFSMSGQLDIFGITGTVDIDIELNTGILIQASLSPVSLMGGKLLSITDAADDGKGPFLDLCTYENDGTAPHATASGTVTLLGLIGESVDIAIGESGATFSLSSTAPDFSYQISATISGSTSMSASGSASVSVGTLDLGVLGSLPLNLNLSVDVSVSLTESGPSASFTGSFSFESETFSLGPTNLNAAADSLGDLAESVTMAAESAVSSYLLGTVDTWLNWINTNIIPNVVQDANAVGAVLSQTYQQADDLIASTVKSVLDYTADEAAQALQGAGVVANDAASALASAGYAADDIANAIESVFNGIHADTSAHIDTSATHIDTLDGDHADTGGNHVDVHEDAWVLDTHQDTSVPHIDTSAHVDAGGHADTAQHIDT